MKTSELTDGTLDWAVAKCEHAREPTNYPPKIITGGEPWTHWQGAWWKPSTDWSQGGPIIERENISITHERPTGWRAETDADHNDQSETGPTPLIAAMRCYVASKLGDEVEVPGEFE